MLMGPIPGDDPLQRELLLQRSPPHAGFDEMVAGNGQVRAHWRDLHGILGEVPAREMTARWTRGQREIAEHGLAFHIHGDAHQVGRRWQLDPLPFPLERQEWDALAKGLKQRATLLEAILADLYGPRFLLREGALPAALVLGHPGYLRPLVGVTPPRGRHLYLYAADLARGPEGNWMVMGDRTDVPGGIGYVLENRQIVARMLPEAVRACPMRPLDPFVDALRTALTGLSPRRFDTPRVVMLTPGTVDSSYFEHAYLAQHLGCMLAEAADLTVRDDRVFLKTLEGLRPVDVLLRATPGLACDPLELASGSGCGIAGLVSAARAGSVSVVNALGCGVVESAALAAYLPALCERLLGESLMLPSVPTWWCGDDASLSHVRANLHRMVLKRSDGTITFGDTLAEAQRDRLSAAIAVRPQAYVGQEIVPLSQAPVWREGQMMPHHMMLRTFVTATDNGPVVMDGGLTRVSTKRALPTLAVRNGEGGSKDTWVLSEAKALPAHHAAHTPIRLTRSGRDLTSRMADNMFWVGRYLERCEDLTRMLRPIYAGTAKPSPAILGQLGVAKRQQGAAALGRLHFNPAHGTGLRANADRLLRSASAIRDRLSLDTWRNMQRLHAEIRAIEPDTPPEDVAAGLNTLVLALEAASGLIMENMTRGPAWRFLDIGRRLERATHIVDLLGAAAEAKEADREALLEALLTISDSSMTYRARYLGSPQLAAVLDLLLCDESNPRSAGFQFAALTDHMDSLLPSSDPPRLRAEQRLMIYLVGTVRTADIDILTRPEEDGRLFKLSSVLEILRSRLWELSETITREYFTHASRRGIVS